LGGMGKQVRTSYRIKNAIRIFIIWLI